MMKKMSGIVLVLVVFATMFSCERNLDGSGEVEYNDGNDKNSEYYENSDDYTWDEDSATIIVFSGDEAQISGSGAIFNKQVLTIDTIGEYVFTGNLTDGQIVVDAGDSDRVKLIFKNLTLACEDDAPVLIENAARAVIILPEGSNNSISDGSSHSTEDSNAAIYSKSDLVITGEGKLLVDANYNDGITGKDGMIIHSGNIEVSAVDDGIRGKDFLVILGGSFDIQSGGDAIISDNEDSDCGYIDVYAGEFIITSTGDGFYALNELFIEDGTFDIFCSSGYDSGKGLKAGNLIHVTGGDLVIESNDDAVHSDLDILVEGGTFNISTNDDAFHAEDELTIEYADIMISDSYEGLEAKTLTIEDGNITLTSSDDGINAASGSAGSMMYPGSSSGDNNLYINGGTIVVYAKGDGIDINGSVQMTGGTLLVHGPTESNNGALDYDGTFVISGGTIVAAGSSGMAMAPSTSSSQYSVLINFTSTFSANTLFNLQDASGNDIVTFKPAHNYQSVAISSPKLSSGSSYTSYTGGTATGELTGGLYEEYDPGSLYKSFTISSKVTTIGNTGGGGGGPRW